MGARSRLGSLAVGVAGGLQAATQIFAWTFSYAEALGAGWRISQSTMLYPPWSILSWRSQFTELPAEAFQPAAFALLLGAAAGVVAGGALAASANTPRRIRGWGDLAEARRSGLIGGGGCILGQLNGRLLATNDMRPSLVTGGTRSGKGRGHVIPSLLSWNHSALVHDPKSELWRTTAGFRSTFSHAMRFAPRSALSARWNPLAEISPGDGEIAQVQRLVGILADPGGARDDEAIWDKAASEILEAAILHVLYEAEDARKTLLTVRDMLADLDDAAEQMGRTLHRLGPDGEPETHPFIRTAVKGYTAMHDRFRTSVQGTARSYLKWLAGDDVERAVSASDFRLGDLMCATAPMSLYVQVAPADAVALRPLVRLMFYAAAQALTTLEDADNQGRRKLWRLLLVMDEFPLLGRIEFFEKSLRLMSGYGLKPMLVAQSLNDIVETYGPHNTILDNCFVFTAFAALDPLTQDKVSRLSGSVSEVRTTRSDPAALLSAGGNVSRSTIDRPLLEPGEVRALPDDQQLVFVAGRRPLRARKLKYDRREPFRSRARLAPPGETCGVDTPCAPTHPWAGRRGLGEDSKAGSPLFKEMAAAINDKKAQSRVADLYERVAADLAAQQAALDHLQGRSDGAR